MYTHIGKGIVFEDYMVLGGGDDSKYVYFDGSYKLAMVSGEQNLILFYERFTSEHLKLLRRRRSLVETFSIVVSSIYLKKRGDVFLTPIYKG